MGPENNRVGNEGDDDGDDEGVDVVQIVLTTMAILGSINHSSILGTGYSV